MNSPTISADPATTGREVEHLRAVLQKVRDFCTDESDVTGADVLDMLDVPPDPCPHCTSWTEVEPGIWLCRRAQANMCPNSGGV